MVGSNATEPIDAAVEEDRPRALLLNSPNRLKMAAFGFNVSGGCSMTSAEGTVAVDWPESLRIAQLAEQAGLDAVIPVARWKGYGGDTNFNDRCFETLTWAAGLAAATSRIQVFATVHVPTVHPVRAAKEAATIDHISGGRLGLNIVAGNNEGEIGMFGSQLLEHSDRYAVAQEWVDLVKRLWTEDTFDFEGKVYHSPGAHSEPKPIQRPGPVLMSAGASPTGSDFAARNADLHFIILSDLEGTKDRISALKDNARTKYGREIKVMTGVQIVCRDTEKDAQDYFNYYVHEKGDWAGLKNLIEILIPGSKGADFRSQQMGINFVAGYGGLPLVGTPEQVVDRLVEMAEAGVDGVTMSWVQYPEGLEQFQRDLLPLLQQAGLRV
jgi:alkanesulfonate monooxygenase SsuD/methylene tetrahydromethanopterin reductase-like flavin-dependent oxidoreductase (luciferase family)